MSANFASLPGSASDDPIAEFKAAMREAGFNTPDAITADGALHRIHVEGDRRGSRNAWYVLHLDAYPAGSFGSWRTGEAHKWSSRGLALLSHVERAKLDEAMAVARKQRDAEALEEHARAATRAAAYWGASAPAQASHPYLQRKQVRAHGARQRGDRLVLPLKDAAGKLWSLQFISPEGEKRFLRGGRKRGCYFGMSGPYRGELVVCEGFATGASITEATGLPVAVAFDAGNLETVAIALREKYPGAVIYIAGDADEVGKRSANAAATAVRGIPVFPEAFE